MDDWEVTVSHVDYPPGRVGAVHHHAGFVLAYVLEGTVVTRISGQGEEKTYTAGQMFYEQPGATHEVSKNASQTEPAKLLAMIFAKKGGDADDAGRARIASMFTWFRRGDEFLRYEAREISRGAYELTIMRSDGTETIERFSNQEALAERQLRCSGSSRHRAGPARMGGTSDDRTNHAAD